MAWLSLRNKTEGHKPIKHPLIALSDPKNSTFNIKGAAFATMSIIKMLLL